MRRTASFEPEQWDYLSEHFQISAHSEQNPACSIPATDLLDQEKCAAYLDRLTSVIGSPSRMVTASTFTKRYAFLIIGPCLYAMTVYNKGLDLSIEHCSLTSSAGDQESRLPNVSLTEMQVTQPSAGCRYEWRDAVIKSLFLGNMAPIFRAISKAATVPMPVLWENAAVRLYSLYEKRLGVGASEQDKVRIREDFEYLVHEAPPASLFGETKNPFAAFYGNTLTAASSCPPARKRKTCCFYYLIDSDGAYCSNCPKL